MNSMRHAFPDRYSRLTSPIHSIRTSIKLIAVSGFLVVTAAVVALLSKVPLLFLLRRLLILEFFVCGVAVLSLFQPGGVAIVTTVFIKSTLCLIATLLFAATTPFADLLHTLKRWHVPSLLVTVLALMYRYIFVLLEELGRMQRARASRTFGRGHIVIWQALATTVAQLFIRSTERAERIFAAMSARGWK
jgi:cobalt/nickel transport system permease protein